MAHRPSRAGARLREGHEGDAFISYCTSGKAYSYKGPYWAPYRCLYSRNIGNLFMAGRDISVNREALGPVRVMKTCGMMGEIVGKAAWICLRHRDHAARGLYEKHLDLLKELMRQPGAMRRDTLEGELSLPAGAKVTFFGSGRDPATLPGVIIDDAAAELTGEWSTAPARCRASSARAISTPAMRRPRPPFDCRQDVGDLRRARGVAAPRQPRQVRTGDGRERRASRPSRSTRPARRAARTFHSLGAFRFEAGRPAAVVYTVAGSRGSVHIDAVQVLPAKP